MPQSVNAIGGFKAQGRDEAAQKQIMADAKAVEQAGAYAIVLEGVPADLGRRITESLEIPTIGIGGGPHCDGQVLVCYDFPGMFKDITPKFVKRFAELGDAIVGATQQYVQEVQAGTFPAEEHSFGMAKPKSLGEPTGTDAVVPAQHPAYGPADGES